VRRALTRRTVAPDRFVALDDRGHDQRVGESRDPLSKVQVIIDGLRRDLGVDMWTSFALTLTTITLIRREMMGRARETELMSAAGYLCSAVENLRAVGLAGLAEELDRYITVLEVEAFLATVARTVQR
jgi:hypothetical protein